VIGLSTDDYGVDLYWLPLGAGGRSVRFNGRAYEAMVAAVEQRPRHDLYHSALKLGLPTGSCVVEMAPVADADGGARGVVAEGPVGIGFLASVRLFRYEVRRWPGGTIPDVAEAVDSPQRLTDELLVAQRIFDVVPAVPTPTWGRDAFGVGDMWNSNSLTSWLLASAGCEVARVRVPANGRIPGWRAGIAAAALAIHAGERPASIAA
jgi:hypothetical protein